LGCISDIGYQNKSIILVGSKRIGKSILTQIPPEKILVIEFDPDVIKVLKEEKYDYLFGDITDPDVYEQLNFSKLKLFISSSPSFAVNQAILEYLKRIRKNVKYNFKVILRARDDFEAKELYKRGADYVLLPHLTSGYYLGKALARNTNLQFLQNLRQRDISLMKQTEEFTDR